MSTVGIINENGGMTLDLSDVKKNLYVLSLAVPDAAKGGLFDAGTALKRDSDNEPPRTPHREGHLRGNFEINPIQKADMTGVEIIYKQPYAARWHEAEDNIDPVTGGRIHWSESGVGPKYLEIKMIRHMKKYFGIVADAIRRRLGT